MAYENTEVAVSKSQDGIRKIIMGHKGAGVMLISRPPHEGFEAFVTISDLPYHVRIMAQCRTEFKDGYGYRLNSNTQAYQNKREQEERRVWRVLFWHLKAMFEAADSGVIDIRDVIMPYVVTKDGRTLSEHIIPHMERAMIDDPVRMLVGNTEE